MRKPTDDEEDFVRVLMPKGLTREVVEEAFKRGAAAEELSPSVPPARWAYLVLAAGRLPAEVRGGMSQEEKVVHRRVLYELGAKIINIHRECDERAPESGEYMTPAWLGDAP